MLSACQEAVTVDAERTISLKRLDDDGICTNAAASQSFNDPLGWQWFRSEGAWCRRPLEGGTAQAWAETDAAPTHRLHIRGGNVGLTDALPVLARLESGQAVSGTCGDSWRMQAFRDQNWLTARGDLDCKGHRAKTGQVIRPIDIAAEGQAMPVLMSQPDVPEDRGTILFLTDGPYRDVVRGLDGHALINHLLSAYGADTAVLIPAYLGTDKLRLGDGDLARATGEIAATIGYARERRRPICVVAHGLGAYAAAPLVAANVGNGFLLLGPKTSAPAAYADRLKANGVQFSRLHLVEGAAGTVEMAGDQALLRYVAGFERQDLNQRLGPVPLPNVEMAYAPNDPAVGPRDLPNLSSKLGGRMHRVTPVGKGAEDPMSFMAYQPALDRFLASCLANPTN